jgi:tetrahydromethanopterin S-methyltransferase subunit D
MNMRRKFNLRPVRVTALAAGLMLVASSGSSSAQALDRGDGTSTSTLKTNAGRRGDTVVPARPAPAAIPQPTPVGPEKKKQARLLGVLGLVICSVLALATGLALLRSLRQR